MNLTDRELEAALADLHGLINTHNGIVGTLAHLKREVSTLESWRVTDLEAIREADAAIYRLTMALQAISRLPDPAARAIAENALEPLA